MEAPKDSCQGSPKPPNPGAEEDQEQQHGGNALVLQAEEVGDKRELVLRWLAQGELAQCDPAQGELDQGELDQGELDQGELDQGEPSQAQSEFAEGKLAQEEPAQFNLTPEAKGVGEEGEKKEEEMGERQAGDGASGPENDNAQQEGGQRNNDQQQPQQEAALPEGSRSQQAGTSHPPLPYSRSRFTHSQLRDLERLFQENRYPSLRTRRDLARWMGVEESDVQNWFRMRRSLYQRNRRMMLHRSLPPLPRNKTP